MRISANGIAIEVDDQGPPAGRPLLMIMGLGMQLIGWPDELVADLVNRGFRVIRFDNRDIGLSQHFDDQGVANLTWAGLRHAMHLPVHSAYTLRDMAADALAVLDALGIERADVCGASMGGMIAQHLAAEAPGRVRSLTLMMTTAGARSLPQPSLAVRQAMLARPGAVGVDALVDHLKHLWAVIGSPGYPPDPVRLQQRLVATVQRSWHPAGTARQLLAVLADGDRTPLLARIAAPTFVIHGEADPLVPVAAGHHLVEHIAGAQGDFIAGMGHDLPLALLPRFAAAIATVAERAPR